MKHLLYILTMLLCLRGQAQSGLVLKGRVLDEHKEAMPGATVFLGGTKHVVSSDTGGHFILTNLRTGDYKIIVKVVGYKPLVKDVQIRQQEQQLVLQLLPDAKYLKSVTVKPDRSWLEKVETFRTQFLGESENAGKCKLVNPGVLSFSYDRATGDLNVDADDLLVITNPQLGYRLKYALTHFVYNEKKGSVVYEGYPSFEELHASKEEEAEWKANRRKAYLGSIHHFMRSIYNQNCKAEGFMVYKIKNRDPFGAVGTTKVGVKIDYNPVSFDSLLTVVDDHHKKLEFSDALYVIYTKEKEQENYTAGQHSFAGWYATRRMPDGEISIVNRLGPISIEESGSYIPTPWLYFEGYMGWEKIGDLVPFEYDPTAD
jgi:hypothetical protein